VAASAFQVPRAFRRGVPAWAYQRLNCQVLGQRAARVGVGHGLGEVVAGHGLAVVALEVQRHAGGKAFAADQRVHHPHHLGALFVDGGGVEVVDGLVGVRAHRVGHGAGVLGELALAQRAHVADAATARAEGCRPCPC
jgi:hypothetical protein